MRILFTISVEIYIIILDKSERKDDQIEVRAIYRWLILH